VAHFNQTGGISKRPEQCDGGGVAGKLLEGAAATAREPLGLLQTVAQSIAVISPTMNAVCYSAGVRGFRTGVSYFKIPLSLGDQLLVANAVVCQRGRSDHAPDGEHGFFPKPLRVVDVKDLTHAPQSASASV
jgi:hypothetical protein